jgi:hypothetical protein
MEQVEAITDYLKRRLKQAGATHFDWIAERATVLAKLEPPEKVSSSFIRKFVYGSRENPRVQTIQPLIDYFAALDRGDEKLPAVASDSRSTDNHPGERAAARSTLRLKPQREHHTPRDKPSS